MFSGNIITSRNLMEQLPTLDEIREAQKLIYQLMQPTPQTSWPLPNQSFGGAGLDQARKPYPNRRVQGWDCDRLCAELFKHSNGIKGLITATRGNHGQSVALTGQ